MQADTAVIRGDNSRMFALKLARVFDATGVSDYTHIMQHVFDIMLHAYCLILRIESSLQALLVGGNTGRACVFIALHGLDTAEGKHETAR